VYDSLIRDACRLLPLDGDGQTLLVHSSNTIYPGVRWLCAALLLPGMRKLWLVAEAAAILLAHMSGERVQGAAAGVLADVTLLPLPLLDEMSMGWSRRRRRLEGPDVLGAQDSQPFILLGSQCWRATIRCLRKRSNTRHTITM